MLISGRSTKLIANYSSTDEREMDMASKKTLVGAAVVGAFFVGGATAATVSDSAFRTVDPIDASKIQIVTADTDSVMSASQTPITVEPDVSESQSSPASVPAGAASNKSSNAVVPGLAERSGVLRVVGDEFYLESREADFGPDRWMIATIAARDLDENGATETWWKEVNGLVGRNVTVLGDVDDDDIDVFQINGVTVRPFDRPAPWSDDWDEDDRIPATTQISSAQAQQIALEQVPGSIIGVELDADDGVVFWEIEVRSTDGLLYDIEIDANSGRVLEVDRD